MKNTLDGGEAIVQAFRNLGVEYVMTSPGSEWGAVWEAFARQEVEKTPGPILFSCAHETLAVDLAIGYTAFTGRPQAVMLHTGVGLLQGAVGIDAAQRQGIPMVVISGEAQTYGDQKGFDPGPQWLGMLSVVGGTHRLVEPLVKWSQQISSPATLYEQMVRAGEMAQRTPAGPTYLSVPIETTLHEWTPPAKNRKAPPAPKTQALPADIEKVAELLRAAKNPAIIVESIGRQAEGYAALVDLAELLAIPVVDALWADYANFPKDHPLYQGFHNPPFLHDIDVLLTVRARAPWYPPSNRPAKATIVAIDEVPIRSNMVHQSAQADVFLEGDAVTSLVLLADAIRAGKVSAAAVKERRERWAAAHKKLEEEWQATEKKVRAKKSIDPAFLCATMREVVPEDAIYVDETISHRGAVMRHLRPQGPQSYFRVHGGLGQGLGVALGVKLANKKRPVVSIIGDGSFMYNPITQSLALSKHESLPILIVVFDNNGYVAMQKEHEGFYPNGVAAKNDLFFGRPITGLEYSELVKPFGGYGRRVTTPAELGPALKEGLAAVKDGKTAILNVALDA